MNFLAHLALSCEDAELQVGNFLGDYTKGKTPEHYPEGVKRGILLHRMIDAATDRHPAVKAMSNRLKPRHGRYAGVVTDIVFDLYLFRHWSALMPIQFDDFARITYANLLSSRSYLSPKLAHRVSLMVNDHWLNTYTSRAGILNVFTRMSSRFSRPELVEGVAETMREEDVAFNQTFLELFPDLQLTVKEFCGCD